jgi:NitT/TauT family transport system ATP-binding protein
MNSESSSGGVATMTDSALELRDLSVCFRHSEGIFKALDEVSLEVPRGQFLVAIGPSGGGKSTLLRVVAGLLKPSEGSVVVDGHPVSGPSGERGMVFQQDAVFPWMRVAPNIAYGLRVRGVGKEERGATVDRYVKAVGLERFAHAWPKELSGGMRKRVAVATAFASDPSLLLMDEPFGSLDFVTRAKLHDILLGLWQETQKTIVFVTHDVDEAIKLADRIIVVSGGGILDDIAVEYPRPRTDALRADPHAIEVREHLLARLGLVSQEVPLDETGVAE